MNQYIFNELKGFIAQPKMWAHKENEINRIKLRLEWRLHSDIVLYTSQVAY